MTNTDFILRRLSILLTLQHLTQLAEAAPASAHSAKNPRRIVPLQAVCYTGFSIPISITQAPRQTLGGWIARLKAALSSVIATTKEKCVSSPLGRILLHCICLARDGHLRWHWAGILRELNSSTQRPLAGARSLPAC